MKRKNKLYECGDYKQSLMDLISKYLEKKAPVVIHYNNETGDWMYSVSVVEDPGFWLDSFCTKKGAEGFCRKHQLPIKDYIRDDK